MVIVPFQLEISYQRGSFLFLFLFIKKRIMVCFRHCKQGLSLHPTMTMAPPPVLSVHRALKSVITISVNLTREDIQGEIEGKPTYGCLYEAS